MSDNIQVVGIDVTDGRDFTVITGMCGNCHTVIDVKLYDPNINQINFPYEQWLDDRKLSKLK